MFQMFLWNLLFPVSPEEVFRCERGPHEGILVRVSAWWWGSGRSRRSFENLSQKFIENCSFKQIFWAHEKTLKVSKFFQKVGKNIGFSCWSVDRRPQIRMEFSSCSRKIIRKLRFVKISQFMENVENPEATINEN